MASITDSIKLAVKRIVDTEEIKLEIPDREEHGDYTTNIAMQKFVEFPISNFQFSIKNIKGPRQLANKIAKKLKTDKELNKVVEKIEVAGPGFLNFWLSKEALEKNLQTVLKRKDKFGTTDLNKGKKVMFEYGQPNTHKLPHVGHLFSFIYGEAMTRIMEATGWTVQRANYQGDVGPQVAKALWAFRLRSGKKIEKLSLAEKVEFLQKMYEAGNKAYEKDEKVKKEIDKINIKIYNKDKSIVPLWKKTRKWSLDYYKNFEKRLGISFDRYYFESEVSDKGKEKVKKHLGRVFKESKAAIIFEGSKYGLHDRVFITKKGTPTYEAKDFFLAELKMKEWPADLLAYSTAKEQNEYFKVIFKALELAHPDYEDKLKHIGFGMVNLKTGKLSSRKGEILGAVELVDSVVERVTGLSESKKIAEVVGLGAVKYSFLKNNPLQDISFDIEESIKEEGNSGPYLQYTYARAKSVLRKAPKLQTSKTPNKWKMENGKWKIEEENLLRAFVHYPEAIQEAAENYAPNLLCNYLYDLAQKYNTFYNAHRILDSQATSDKLQVTGSKTTQLRLALTQSTAQILKSGLTLLGIEAPERM